MEKQEIREYTINTTIVFKGPVRVMAASLEDAEEKIEYDLELSNSPLFNPQSAEDWELRVQTKECVNV